MIIGDVRLTNFCQHRDLYVTLEPGLNLIVGPNGSGKTNFLRALQLLLTGDAGGDRNKADDITQGIADDAPSFVETNLSHGGSIIYVRRAVGKYNSSNFLCIGDTEISSINEMNAELWRRLGATKRQIQDYVFVRQRKIDEMFDQRPADRAAALAALFGIDQAEKVWRQMGEFLSNIEVPTTTLDADELRQQLAQHAETGARLSGELLAYRDVVDASEYMDQQLAIIRGYDERTAANATVLQAAGAESSKRHDVLAQRAAARRFTADIGDIALAITAMADDVRNAEGKLQQWRTYDATKATREQFAQDQQAYTERWANGVDVPQEPCAALSDAEREQLDWLTEAHTRVVVALSALSQSLDNCPTCGQRMPDFAEAEARRTTLLSEQATIVQERDPLCTRDDARKQYAVDMVVYRQEQHTWETEQAQLEQRSNALAELVLPDTDRVVLRNCLDERDSFATALTELQTQSSTHATQLAEAEGELTQLAARTEEARAVLVTSPPYTKANAEAAQRARDTVRRRYAAMLALQKQHAVAEANVTTVQAQLDDIQRITQQGERTRETVAHLENIRQVFHRNESPRMVSYTYIETMLDEVNSVLETFEAPFRVEMDESLGFIARFLDGVRVQPDKRLSVGERIVLAMAFRVTVNSTFAGQVGVLVLDEPTAGLDEHNLGCLPTAIARLRELSAERGLQVLFVTHEPRIQHLFDHTITLPTI